MKRLRARKREQGVTLVELMIVVAILGVVVAAAYNMFEFQQKSYTVQDQVAVMQQNVRVGLEYMVKEIRMAGYVPEDIPPNNTPPTGDVTGQAFANGVSEPIEEATASTITLQADVDDDEQTETVRYALNGTNLERNAWKWGGGAWGNATGAQTVADNIEAINFTYFLLADDDGLNNDTDDDGDGQTDEAGELLTWNFGVHGNLDTNDERGLIRQITLTMTARVQNPDPDYRHPQQDDPYRRRTLTSKICLRNMKNQDEE